MEGWQYLAQMPVKGGGRETWPAVEQNFDNAGPQYSGFNVPTRYEGAIQSLEVQGQIPVSIAGTYYRVMPDPQYVPFVKNDIWLNGDGSVSAFRIKNGQVDFNQKYVKTEKLQAERIERRALLGKYRNPFTDLVSFTERTVANTTVIPYKGRILALKEDGRPYALDPLSLETLGIYDFEGQWEAQTFTAHPKYDTTTRELLAFGYEAKGLATRDNFYASIDEFGHFTEKVWFQAPFCGFQHEMAFTENWVIFPMNPMECFIEDLKKGGNHWIWTERPHYIGVLPRRGAKSSDIKWFYGPNHFTGHVSNAYEENGKIKLHMTVSHGNGFGFFPDREGKAPPMGSLPVSLCEWAIDPHAKELRLDTPKKLVEPICEFPRVDDRVFGRKNRYCYGLSLDMTPGKTDWEFNRPKIGDGIQHFNALYKQDHVTGELKIYRRGPRHSFQEPQFVPRDINCPEGDGYLIALVNNLEEMTSELVILDCDDFENHIALVKLPLRLRPGFHGSWVDDCDIEGRPQPSAGHVKRDLHVIAGNGTNGSG